MKKEELQSEEHSKSVLNEPVAQYYSRINVPKRIYEIYVSALNKLITVFLFLWKKYWLAINNHGYLFYPSRSGAFG